MPGKSNFCLGRKLLLAESHLCMRATYAGSGQQRVLRGPRGFWEGQLRLKQGTLCPANVTCAQERWMCLGRVALPGESNLCLGRVFLPWQRDLCLERATCARGGPLVSGEDNESLMRVTCA